MASVRSTVNARHSWLIRGEFSLDLHTNKSQALHSSFSNAATPLQSLHDFRYADLIIFHAIDRVAGRVILYNFGWIILFDEVNGAAGMHYRNCAATKWARMAR